MKFKSKLLSSEVTSKDFWMRRKTLKTLSTSVALGTLGLAKSFAATGEKDKDLIFSHVKQFSTKEDRTDFSKASSYNNFYEFGTDKSDPKKYAHELQTSPWSVTVHGDVLKPKIFDLDDLRGLAPLEERVYRLRCVEGWSMVIPWIGYPLSSLIKKVLPTGNAKYVEFTTLYRPEEMRGQRRSVLDWPYIEGLRLDEAMNPLTLLSFGMYGSLLPTQNGAPVRVIVPWKYGFKSPKAIVSIRLTEKQPQTAWMQGSPKEYGFYSNVNPNVRHPRWSQSKERRIGELRKRDTVIFNGYADYVAHLYEGMDLKKFF